MRSEYLNKFIYSETYSKSYLQFANKNTANKNFWVYMVNVQHDNSEQPIEKDGNGEESTSANERCATKERDSYIKLNPTKMKKVPAPNSPLNLPLKQSSKSRIPISASKANLNEVTEEFEKYKKCSSLHNISSMKAINQKESKTNWGVDLFKKIIGKQRSKQTAAPVESIEELYVRDCCSSEVNMRVDKLSKKDENKHLSNLKTQDIYAEQDLLEGLRQMIEIGNKIQESETRVKDMIIKYINDRNLESELVNTICGHGKILLDSERRTLKISSETWFQQAEIYKDQQKSLQNTIDSIIAQNRELQVDYDAVVKKNEKLCAKIIFLQESSEIGLPKNSRTLNNNESSLRMVEDLNKNNDRLRGRVHWLSLRIDNLDDSLKKSQKKTSYLQQQLKNSSSMLQNVKTSYDRNKSDYELEIAKLLHDIQMSNSAVKEAVEAGDVLLDDLDSLKSQFKCQSKSINWDKFKRRGKSLVDLIHLSRSCINELSKELVNKNNELNSMWQQNENLKVENEEKNVALNKLDDEKENSQKVLLECKELEINLKNVTEKCKELEEISVNLESQNEANKLEIEENKLQHKMYEEKVNNLIATISEKSEALVQLRVTSGKLEQERDSLQVQINGMTQVLSATGAGDIAKELAATQEKLSKMQAQYFSATSDKNYLTKQIEAYTAERETLLSYQKTCYDQLQLLRKDIGTLEKANENLTEQLETEKRTVSALQSERVRHLEERTVLTAIYERLRSEVSKVDQLEGAVTTMNQRANKLAMIADYNKKMGRRLQHRVAEKEIAISELHSNLKELEDIHVESTKEKVALCEELAEVFNTKEVLNNKLNVEKERSALLGESKKEIEYVVISQLKEMHGLYKREFHARKTLSKDIKSILSQRNALEIINEENKQKIMNLQIENTRLAEEQIKLRRDNDHLSEKVAQLDDFNLKASQEHKDTLLNLEEKCELYKETIDTMKELFEPMSTDRERLKGCVDYLQADIRNLRAELNHARESELSYKSLLLKENERVASLRLDLDSTTVKFQELNEEYFNNKDQLLSLADSYDELKEEYEYIMQEANRFKLILSEKFATSRDSRATNTTFEFIDSSNKDEIIVELQERNRELELQNIAFTEVIGTLKANRDALLQQQIEDNEKFKHTSTSFKELLEHMIDLENKFKALIGQCSELKEDENNQPDLNVLQEGNKLDYDGTSDELKSFEKSQGIIWKLEKSIQMLLTEKAAREGFEAKIQKIESEKAELQEGMVSAEKKLSLGEQTIENMRAQLIALQNDRDDLKCLLNEVNNKLEAKEDIAKTSKSTLVDFSFGNDNNEERVESLKAQLGAKYNEISRLEDELSSLESKCALLEFQRCESILCLHEVQGKMFTEVARNKELKSYLQRALADFIKVKDEGGDLYVTFTVFCESIQKSIEDDTSKEICNK